jgi:hypothetical protein
MDKLNRAAKNRLTEKELFLFTGDTLFDKIARAVCRAGTLPRKELYEAWETARRVRRKFRGGRVVDMACGHGLLAHIMLLLDDSSPSAVAIDARISPNAGNLSRTLIDAWSRLDGRIAYVEKSLENIDIRPDDVVVSVHACGQLTDTIIKKAVAADARIAVLPCCHDVAQSETGSLEGWMDGPLAVDVMRAAFLRENGYTVMTRKIPGDITPKNRLLMGYVK